MDAIKEIAESLKIEFIIPQIDQIIANYEKFSEKIDEQQNKVETIEELFGWLHNIKSLTVETVKSSILGSEWIIEEDGVIELAAFVLQTIGSSCELHSYLADLLISLDKEANETNKLSILLPFVIKQMMFSLGENLTECSFIYNLYKKGVLPKEKLMNEIKYILYIFNDNSKNRRSKRFVNSYTINNLRVWFLPELMELNITIKSDETSNKKEFVYGSRRPGDDLIEKFIQFYSPDKIELYKKMRDSGEPDDELTKALRKDDVDKAQSIITQTNLNINDFIVPFNIFDGGFLLNIRMKLIDYAAAFGSVNCFKYLKLSHSEITDITFQFAIYGGNTEIIKIVDQDIGNKKSTPHKMIRIEYNRVFDTNCINPAISKHKNDIFDWVLEQKFSPNGEKNTKSLLEKSVSNGNAHAFIEVVDKYVTNYDFQELFEKACEKGFYKLATLISDISVKKADPQKHEVLIQRKFVSFGNLSIYKLCISDNVSEFQYIDSLCTCVEKDYKSIFNYIFDEIIKKDTSKLVNSFFFKNCN